MSSSITLPVAKVAVVAGLVAAFPTVQVVRHHPGDLIQRETVFTGRAVGTSTIPVMRAGRKKRQEDYTFDVFFLVAKHEGEQDAEDRAYELLAGLETFLATNPTLGIDSTLVATLATFESETGFDPETNGWATILRAAVRVMTRLQ